MVRNCSGSRLTGGASGSRSTRPENISSVIRDFFGPPSAGAADSAEPLPESLTKSKPELTAGASSAAARKSKAEEEAAGSAAAGESLRKSKEAECVAGAVEGAA